MYEPFEQAIDQYQEHPEHLQPLAVFEARLTKCDTCTARRELQCSVNTKCRCSLVRWAQRLTTACPWGRWS